MAENPNKLKSEVHNYWDNETCGTWFTDKDKYTKEYFEDIEKSRYEISPEIIPFAEFNKFYQIVAKIAAKILGGDKAGWFLTFQFRKK